MARARRNIPSLDRRGPRRQPKRSFFIYCEGNTEREYFLALRAVFKNALIGIEADAIGGVPATVVDRAIGHLLGAGAGRRRKAGRSSFEGSDQVWAVFDRDVHTSYYEAAENADRNGVGVGRSNPCFELWLILHKQDFDRPDGHKNVQKHFQGLCPEYDPDGSKLANWKELLPCLADAEMRARTLCQRREEERGGKLNPPYTTVWELIAEIRKADEASRG